MGKLGSVLEFVGSCLVYSLIVVLVDFVVTLFFTQELDQLTSSVSFIMLIESGIGLAFGGAVVMYSPVVSKMGEFLFHSKPWTAKRQKEVEKQARVLIVVGCFLLLLSLLLSAV